MSALRIAVSGLLALFSAACGPRVQPPPAVLQTHVVEASCTAPPRPGPIMPVPIEGLIILSKDSLDTFQGMLAEDASDQVYMALPLESYFLFEAWMRGEVRTYVEEAEVIFRLLEESCGRPTQQKETLE